MHIRRQALNKDIVSFAERHLDPFTVKGDEIVSLYCPFCGGGRSRDRDTFALNGYDGAFNCKRGSCAAKGSFVALASYFGEKTERKRSVQFDKREKQYSLPQIDLHPLTDEIIEYFDKRKISKATLEAFKVSATDEGKIIFPFYMKGKLTYAKYRNPWKPKEATETTKKERKEWQEPDAQPILFGMDECSYNFPLIVTEGMVDSLSLAEAGIPNAVSVPSGADNFDWISPCWEFIERFNKIILFGDNDEPGQRMVDTIVRRLGEDRCYVISEYPLRPDGQAIKDANEALYFLGKEALVDMIDKAEAVPVKGLIDLGDIVPIDPTTVPRIRIGIPALDAVVGGLHEGDVVVLTGKSGGGKLLADDTPVITSNGWKNHGDLKVGDFVLAPSGDFVKVTHVFPKHYANREVVFGNGERIKCHEDHEWQLEYHSGDEYKTRTLETKDIESSIFTEQGNFKHKLIQRVPMKGNEKSLPVHPYMLGVWLGDGRNSNPDIANAECDRAIVASAEELGYPVSWFTKHKTTGVYTYGFKGLRKQLRSVGMCISHRRTDKHIPIEYLTASYSQRMDLLAGLLDTDGYLDNKDRCRYEFSTTEEGLRDGFCDLISTFGWRYSIREREPKLTTSGIQGRKLLWAISFSPDQYIPCRVERKKCSTLARKHRIPIVLISKIDPVQGNCIEVEGGLYCAGRTMLPTHNSTFSGPILLNAIEQNRVVCAYSGELSKEKFQQWINLQCAGSEYIGLKYDKVREKNIPFITPQVHERIRDWYKGKFFLFDNTEVFDTDEQTSILKTFSVAARRHGASVFLVDNLMTSIADAEDEMKAQGSFVSSLKKFAKRFKCSVILVAHPRKTKAGDALGKDDVSGNSAIVNLCDTGIAIERPDLRIIKNRDEGFERLIPCCYAPDSRRIYQADVGDKAIYSWNKVGIPLASPRADSSLEYEVQMSKIGGGGGFSPF